MSLDTSSEADLSLSDTTSVTQMPLQRTSSKRSTSESSCHSQAKRQAPSSNIMDTFTLPKFSPDIARAIKDDAFHTAALRNKLIRESCRALKGHCQLHRSQKPPTGNEKRNLGKVLLNLAPKSLGDPQGLEVAGTPEVSKFYFQLTIFTAGGLALVYQFSDNCHA